MEMLAGYLIQPWRHGAKAAPGGGRGGEQRWRPSQASFCPPTLLLPLLLLVAAWCEVWESRGGGDKVRGWWRLGGFGGDLYDVLGFCSAVM